MVFQHPQTFPLYLLSQSVIYKIDDISLPFATLKTDSFSIFNSPFGPRQCLIIWYGFYVLNDTLFFLMWIQSSTAAVIINDVVEQLASLFNRLLPW